MTSSITDEQLPTIIVNLDLPIEPPGGLHQLREDVTELVAILRRTGVWFKVKNTIRCFGYEFIQTLHKKKIHVFADIRANTSNRCLPESDVLAAAAPDMISVQWAKEAGTIEKIRSVLPHARIVKSYDKSTQTDITQNSEYMVESVIQQSEEIFAPLGVHGGLCKAAQITKGEKRLATIPEALASPENKFVIVGQFVTSAADPVRAVEAIQKRMRLAYGAKQPVAKTA